MGAGKVVRRKGRQRATHCEPPLSGKPGEGGEWRAERAGRIADEVIEVAGQER